MYLDQVGWVSPARRTVGISSPVAAAVGGSFRQLGPMYPDDVEQLVLVDPIGLSNGIERAEYFSITQRNLREPSK
jgi:hypothetical protein